ncbi:cell wall-binding repeat-containing protein [Desulfosporosinus nitroreducens]|uniref:Cell wall-binding repeat-containing protein n=1 Tax=Desulfosporosinus nitroreducens TaxID=2018668 RepID=A0ABT8QT33_9FIRM|nr:cell wall-binding repeat-containing protein [Desulfosporosinus nitroreducens]MDO0824305.1 cell wall-binding repeat-containing protein [Desulfosporosinus nitroreducens]
MRKKWPRLFYTSMAIGLACVLGFSEQIFSATTATPSLSSFSGTAVTRLEGIDQYETASKIAGQGWAGTSDAVVLAAGMTPNLVDALAAGPFSAMLEAPLILTDGGNQLNPWAKQEIQRLKPSKAFIISGTAVIKPPVLAELKEMGITPVELGGYDQYETSVNIAKEMINQGVQVSQVVVAAGWTTSADALSIAAIAATQGIPILETTRDALPPSVKSFLNSQSGITDSYVIGGTAVVGNTVQAQLPGTVHRYAGLTKYDTNIEVLKGFKDVLQNEKTYVANGETLVDALAGVPLAAQSSSAILLTDQTLPTTSCDYVLQNVPTEVIALGGQTVVPQSVLEHVMSSLPVPLPGSTQPTVKVLKIQMHTVPSYNSDEMSNDLTFDMSGAQDKTQVTGFSVTVDQPCDLQLDKIDKIIPLSGGQATLVNLDDLISGTHGGNGISLKTFRAFYGDSVSIQGELKKNGSVVGNLSITIKL